MSSGMEIANDNLVTVVQLFRHGHRTPVIPYPNDPYQADTYSPTEIGDLTNRGKREMYDLGCFTRKRYQNFLPAVYQKKDFAMYTTEMGRSITSAHLYTAGLYPPTEAEMWNVDLKWNPIPTKQAPPSVLRSMPIGCASYADLFLPAMAKHLENFKKDPLCQYIVQHSGVEGNDIFDFIHLYDALNVQDSLGLELPGWTQKVYPELLRNISRLYLETTVLNEKMIRLCIGPFLNEVIRHFDKMLADPTSGPKLMAYSGHDTNIVSLLSAVGAYKSHMPPFASSIYFELRKVDDEPIVNIYYKTEDVVPVSATGCEFNCKFRDFKEVLKNYVISSDMFYVECEA